MTNEKLIQIIMENTSSRIKSRKYRDMVKSEVEIALRIYIEMTEKTKNETTTNI